MDINNLLTNSNEIEKEQVIKFAKQNFPWLMYDRVPIEFDDRGRIKNKTTASAIWGWQREVIYNLKPKETPIVISHLTNGSGKASRHSAKVWTPEGYKLMEDIKKGDLVLTPDGQSVRVLAKYPQGVKSIYKVSFSDGSSTDVTEDHLWEVLRWKGGNGVSKEVSEVKSTKDLIGNLTINAGKSWKYSIPLVQDAAFNSRSISIDPYLMGLLLGDGCFRHRQAIGFTNEEADIIDYVKSHGFTKVESSKYDYKKYGKSFYSLFESYGLLNLKSGDKFIPNDYKYNTREVRLKVLQGLMDTDGCITTSKPSDTRVGGSRTIEFSSKSRQLCEDVKFLVMSLGGLANDPVERVTKCNGQEFTSYRIHLKVDNSLNIFNTKRKADIFNSTSCRMAKRFITSIDLIGEDEASCISVDHPRHLYIVDDLICTHNTFTITLSLSLLLIDDHPSLSAGFKDVKGEFWLLTNPSLITTEYRKAFLSDPGLLGNEDDYRKDGYKLITNSKGETHEIRLVKGDKGEIIGFRNVTTGKSIRMWSYSVNEQKLAGHNPLSIFCDEFGDKTTTSQASGANKLTWGKFEEMIVRCGRNHMAGDNWVFCLFFTLTLGEPWIEDLIDLAKEGRAVIEDLNKDRGLPEGHQTVHLVKGTKSSDNPFINKSTISMALGLGNLLGRSDSLARRLISTDGDDPNIVFPRSCRPTQIDLEKANEIIQRAQSEPGWMFVEAIDPGWSDKCAILMTLCHPIHGIYVLDEFYESGYTVPQVARVVKEKEHSTFMNIKVHKRIYDPNHIKKTTQETAKANYTMWRDAGLPGVPCVWSRGDRSYDRMFELILKGLIYYYRPRCEGLDKELRTHRKDKYGIPNEKGNNHSIDCLRYISNWFYVDFAKKIHLANPRQDEPMSESRRAYLAQLEYYNQFIKPQEDRKAKGKLMGCSISRFDLNKIKGFKSR